jgi:hypothetical protein
MLTASEWYALQTRADNGLLLLVITVGAVLLLGVWFRRLLFAHTAFALDVRWSMPAPLPLPLVSMRLAPIGWIALAGLLLRLPGMLRPLWYDEVFTANIAAVRFDQLAAAILGDVHPPLYYLIEWGIVRLFGSSAIALRFPALLFGVGCVFLTYRLVLVLKLNERTALIAAALVAVLPATIYYANEARAYSLLLYMALYALTAVLSNRPKAFFVCGLALPYLHNIGYVYLGVFSLIALIIHRREWRRWLNWIVLAGVLSALWLPFLLQQSRDLTDGFWLPQVTNLGSVFAPALTMTMGIRQPGHLLIPVYAPSIGMSLIGVFMARRWLAGSVSGRVLAVVTFGIPALVALVSVLWAPVYLHRALLPCVVGLVILWAIALDKQPRWGLLLAPAIALAIAGTYAPEIERPNAGPIFEQACAGADAIYATGVPAALYASHYLPAQTLSLWNGANDNNQTLSADAKSAFGFESRALDFLDGDVCIVTFTTPLTRDVERSYIASVLAAHPITASDHRQMNETWVIDIYRLSVQQPVQ